MYLGHAHYWRRHMKKKKIGLLFFGKWTPTFWLGPRLLLLKSLWEPWHSAVIKCRLNSNEYSLRIAFLSGSPTRAVLWHNSWFGSLLCYFRHCSQQWEKWKTKTTNTFWKSALATLSHSQPMYFFQKLLVVSIFWAFFLFSTNTYVLCITEELVMLSTLGKIFSRRHFEILFLFFPENRI